uniref:Peptidase S54 rhomboid domain-containing protein n=1 Tax=Chromera velia CCMP2878 TaxID=1169474 RepID=A0A0G4IEQ6_9ALVE|eukprot:Cvel_13708.t1-p1 / transcript=Cvel_13708.t1 / gene=Cvel_13708 / organism=Chromera_velia_CCMP2878 / gene_product=hypothetical protein / transcript_product=hypothetical protein / location=Cvel_scaffold947:44030-44998(-) / protein_length=323 / sequence_SO=supercontig / SO=protein_coding / is_pseudo=false
MKELKHTVQDYLRTTISTVKRAVTEDISSEEDLLRASLCLHYALSAALTLCDKYVVESIMLVNGLIFLGWQAAIYLRREKLMEWLKRHCLLHSNFRKHECLPISLVLSEFSHHSQSHLFSNMATLSLFGPLARMKLGAVGFAQLYSAGVFASVLASCLWPQVAERIGVSVQEDFSALGASGAISALIMFTSLLFGDHPAGEVKVPERLQALLGRKTMKMNLAMRGLIWGVEEVSHLIFPPDADEECGRINYSAHVGGLSLGAAFFLLHIAWTSQIARVAPRLAAALFQPCLSALRFARRPFSKSSKKHKTQKRKEQRRSRRER